MDGVDLVDPLTSYQGIDAYRAEYRTLVDLVKAVHPAGPGCPPYEVAGLAVAGCLLLTLQLPLPAVYRVVQTLARRWPNLTTRAQTGRPVEVMILDGRTVVEPFVDDRDIKVNRAFQIADMSDVAMPTLGRATVYTVLDVQYVVMVVEAAMKAGKPADAP